MVAQTWTCDGDVVAIVGFKGELNLLEGGKKGYNEGRAVFILLFAQGNPPVWSVVTLVAAETLFSGLVSFGDGDGTGRAQAGLLK